MNEKGPMTTLGVEALAFVNTKYAPPGGKIWLITNNSTKIKISKVKQKIKSSALLWSLIQSKTSFIIR